MLPIAMLWFGLGMPSLVFVMVLSVVWTVSLNTLTGFQTIPVTQRMAGQNFGLRGIGYIFQISDPRSLSVHIVGT